ncbi:MAG: lytic transglycosylase domain-containing protein [Pseudomonadota bacterium]
MIYRILLVFTIIFASSQSAQAVPTPLRKPTTCKTALELASARKWPEALQHAKSKACPTTTKLIQWLQLRQGDTDLTFQDYARFISQNTHWPWISALRKQAEAHIKADTQPEALLSFFKSFPPLTYQGAVAYIDALFKSKRSQQAATIVRKTWTELPLTSTQQQQFLKDHGKHLRLTDHISRAKHMLASERVEQVKRMLSLLPHKDQQIAKIRLAFITKDPQAGKLAKALPTELQEDSGLLYNWIKWHRRHDNLEGAMLFLAKIPTASTKTAAWWREQMALAREALNQNQPKLAYQVLEHHPWKTGRHFCDAEWFLGWVALTYLDDPKQSYDHFRRMARDAQTATSRAQAYYWMGRVTEAGSQPERAKNWYQKAAGYPTTFYGQQSMQKLKSSKPLNLKQPAPFSGAESFDAASQELAVAARLLKQMEATEDILSFVYLINKRANTSAKRTQAMHFIREVYPEYLVESLKIHGITNAWSYPLAKHWIDNSQPNAAFILAIVRQESNFNQFIRSPADALGLIQLVPGTAKLMAKKLNMPYERKRLTHDPAYNLKLGIQYISDRLEEFDGSLVLTLASYNAGPTPVYRWIKRNGDPRLEGVDLIQWIERISYGETRDYVKYVLSNYWIYLSEIRDQKSARQCCAETLRRYPHEKWKPLV